MVNATSLCDSTGFRVLVATTEHISFLHHCFFLCLSINHLLNYSVCLSISSLSSRVRIKDSALTWAVDDETTPFFRCQIIFQSALEEIVIIIKKETLPFNFCFRA